jgi:nicotinamidase-related amidase
MVRPAIERANRAIASLASAARRRGFPVVYTQELHRPDGTERRYNAFFGTDLDVLLRSQGIENLLVTGGCTDICVISTVHGARDLDYRCSVIEDASTGRRRNGIGGALECMSHVFAYVARASEIADLFGLQTSPAAAAR